MAPRNSKSVKTKTCIACPSEKASHPISDFYKSKNPLHQDGYVPWCKECIKNNSISEETGEIDIKKFKNVLRQIDKPYYEDLLLSSENQYNKEHGYVSDDDLKFQGKDIIGIYFKNIQTLRQYVSKSYEDSMKDNFSSKPTSNTKTKTEISRSGSSTEEHNNENQVTYCKRWRGKYTNEEIECLDEYYAGLQRDYNIVTENHRDYARKIAKASLMMDKAYEDLLARVDGAESRYKNAKEVFDSLSKSAKFSEDKRSLNDVGVSSFSKIVDMVEEHNWIPEHKPVAKDDIDQLIDYLSTITKSV